MNLALLIKQPLLKKIFLKQLAYYAKGWFLFKEQSNQQTSVTEHHFDFANVDSSKAKVVVVAQAHYSQSLQSYPSVSKKELKKIILLQKQTDELSASLFQVIANPSIDGFDVKKITFDEGLINLLGNKRVLIPETELLSDENNSLLSLDTPAGLLFTSFFSQKILSSYAKGLVSNIEMFKLSSGLPLESEHENIDELNFCNFLFTQLSKHNIDVLFNKSVFNFKNWFSPKDLHMLYWAPLMTAGLFYVLSNSYLWLSSYHINNQLAEQNDSVKTLLANKQAQDQQKKHLNIINAEFSQTTRVHSHWSIVYDLVENDMTITRVSFNGDIISISGVAENASKILTKLSKNDYVKTASFKGGVSKRGTETSFTLEIIPIIAVDKKNNLASSQIESTNNES